MGGGRLHTPAGFHRYTAMALNSVISCSSVQPSECTGSPAGCWEPAAPAGPGVEGVAIDTFRFKGSESSEEWGMRDFFLGGIPSFGR